MGRDGDQLFPFLVVLTKSEEAIGTLHERPNGGPFAPSHPFGNP
jgi:hypothetical protein